MTKYLFILPLVLLISCAGSQKEAFMSDVDSFVAEVEQQHEKYDEKDWKKKNEEFGRLLESEFEDVEEELTEEEKVHIVSQVMSYTTYQISERISEDLEENSEEYSEAYSKILNESAELIETLGDEFTQEILPEIEALAPQFESLGKDFVNRLKDSGALDNIMDALKDFGKEVEKAVEELEKEGKLDIQIDTDDSKRGKKKSKDEMLF
ncbi:MAG: hypothetical protein MRZ79_24405 [Bacteroidia bacterium]|nr:hypothetical protein [Bacteroidia bacterium]